MKKKFYCHCILVTSIWNWRPNDFISITYIFSFSIFALPLGMVRASCGTSLLLPFWPKHWIDSSCSDGNAAPRPDVQSRFNQGRWRRLFRVCHSSQPERDSPSVETWGSSTWLFFQSASIGNLSFRHASLSHLLSNNFNFKTTNNNWTTERWCSTQRCYSYRRLLSSAGSHPCL